MPQDQRVVQFIQNIPWFSELTPLQVERLALISSIRELQSGEELFREGDRADYLYIILSGELILENFIPSVGKHEMTRAEPLDVVGWSSLTPVIRQRASTIRAAETTTLLAIEGDRLAKLCEEDHDLGYFIMRRVANIVASQFLSTQLRLYDMIRNTSHSLAQSNLF